MRGSTLAQQPRSAASGKEKIAVLVLPNRDAGNSHCRLQNCGHDGTNDGDTTIVPVVARMVELACAATFGAGSPAEGRGGVEEWL